MKFKFPPEIHDVTHRNPGNGNIIKKRNPGRDKNRNDANPDRIESNFF